MCTLYTLYMIMYSIPLPFYTNPASGLSISDTGDAQAKRRLQHPLRLQLDLIWAQKKEGETQYLVCARRAIPCRMRLGEQLMVGF
jgi:hypothetical protein